MTDAYSRFMRKVHKHISGCWLWAGAKDKDGYGQVKWNGVTCAAHRVSYELHNGTIPEGKLLMHTCDTPACVRPSHLIAGTQSDNMKDRQEKGRDKGTFKSKKEKTDGNE